MPAVAFGGDGVAVMAFVETSASHQTV